jgi:hypothetical protein
MPKHSCEIKVMERSDKPNSFVVVRDCGSERKEVLSGLNLKKDEAEGVAQRMRDEERAKRTGASGYEPECLEPWERPDSYMGETYEDYFVVYSKSRDSDLLTQSNFDAILKEHGDKEGVEVNRASHWAVGWVEFIMVRKDAPRDVIEALDNDICYLEDYPVLDENDFSSREFEETIENIKSQAKVSLTDEEAGEVFRRLPDDDTQPVDGGGAWPKEESVAKAVWELTQEDKMVGEPFEALEKRYGRQAVKHFKEKLTEGEWATIKTEEDDFGAGDDEVQKILDADKGRFRLTQFLRGQRRIE